MAQERQNREQDRLDRKEMMDAFMAFGAGIATAATGIANAFINNSNGNSNSNSNGNGNGNEKTENLQIESEIESANQKI